MNNDKKRKSVEDIEDKPESDFPDSSVTENSGSGIVRDVHDDYMGEKGGKSPGIEPEVTDDEYTGDEFVFEKEDDEDMAMWDEED